MRSQSDSDKNFEPCRLAPKALKSRFSKLHGVRIKCTSLDFQIGKNISPKYSSCWNLQVVSALLVFRNWEPQTHISSSKLILVLLPEEAWLSLIPLLLTRHDRNFVGCTKTYNYLVRESNAKNQAFGQKWPKVVLLFKDTEPYPVIESNSKNTCFGKEWPKLVLLRRKHLEPARQDSQPKAAPNATSRPASQPTTEQTSQPTKYKSCRRR